MSVRVKLGEIPYLAVSWDMNLSLREDLNHLMKYYQVKSEKISLIVGCNTNKHHVMKSNKDIKLNGDKLLPYLVSTELVILSVGEQK